MTVAPPMPAPGADVDESAGPATVTASAALSRVAVATRLATGLGLVVFVLEMVGSDRSYGFDASQTVGRFVSGGDPWRALTHSYIFNNHVAFSVLESLVWRLGGTSEAAQRILPALFGAAAVAVLARWAIRRYGVVAGLAAGAVVAALPLTAVAAHDVRGYSLVVLCVVVAATSVAERRPHAAWIVAASMALAIGTHLFAGIALVGIAAWVATDDRTAWRRWWKPAAAAAGIGVAIHLPTLAATLTDARHRPGPLRWDFPITLGRDLLGTDPLAVAMLAVVVGAALIATARTALAGRVDGPALAATLAVGVGGVGVWIVLHPLDLYTRFFIWLVPLTGVAVAAAIARWRVLVIPVAVAVVAMVALEAPTWTVDPVANRQIAATLDAAHVDPARVCSTLHYAEPMFGYGYDPVEVTRADQLSRCDVLLGPVSAATSPVVIAASHQWTTTLRFDRAVEPAFVISLRPLPHLVG